MNSTSIVRPFLLQQTLSNGIIHQFGRSVGEIFNIFSHLDKGDHPKISFKCSHMSYEILREQPDIITAPYLARAKSVQLVTSDAMANRLHQALHSISS